MFIATQVIIPAGTSALLHPGGSLYESHAQLLMNASGAIKLGDPQGGLNASLGYNWGGTERSFQIGKGEALYAFAAATTTVNVLRDGG